MMTSSNGNIFRVTGPLCGELTGPGEFPAQRPVTRSFDVFFDLRLNKRLGKQPWSWWFETPPWSLWRQCNDQAIRKRLEMPEVPHRHRYWGCTVDTRLKIYLPFYKHHWLNPFLLKQEHELYDLWTNAQGLLFLLAPGWGLLGQFPLFSRLQIRFVTHIWISRTYFTGVAAEAMPVKYEGDLKEYQLYVINIHRGEITKRRKLSTPNWHRPPNITEPC